jgi:CRP-like cAMP-binding protein
MEKISCISCSNKKCFVQKYCSAEWLHIIDKSKHQISFKQNQDITSEGFPILGVFIIQSGKVKIYTSGLNQKQQIVRLASPGHLIGHRGFDNEVYPIGARTMDNSTVCFIENKILDEIFDGNPKFVQALMKFYLIELRKMENRMKNIAQMNLREKISDALLLILENFGLDEKQKLDVPFSREDIANIAGTTPEQAIKQLTEFEEEKFILKVERKIKILNIEGLQNMVTKFNQHVPMVS